MQSTIPIGQSVGRSVGRSCIIPINIKLSIVLSFTFHIYNHNECWQMGDGDDSDIEQTLLLIVGQTTHDNHPLH